MLNKEGNKYTVIYAAVMVIIVAMALAFTAETLRERQNRNAEIDKKMQLLRSIKVASTANNAEELFRTYITSSYIITSAGERTDGDAFSINREIEKEVRKPANERKLPVYEATVDGTKKYIIPLYGAGLWGPVWGYVSLNSDRNTVYGATFGHKGETPGLGAEIETESFSSRFSGKHLLRDGKFTSIAVVKSGQTQGDVDCVDGISGGTITSQGVSAMLKNCLQPYEAFLKVEN
ncbi:MAG: NADH:ubiquinone reductase (Na(+)-transporting) subunit C [Bacteroidales bacterium]|jgi:Na+-transporting NADH:ubiquinone oxidoreductase subunit C|nr:NADH:ubiquinone reductase (Na(+)-transporting) subunit C [Bacteroidales bacterium]